MTRQPQQRGAVDRVSDPGSKAPHRSGANRTAPVAIGQALSEQSQPLDRNHNKDTPELMFTHTRQKRAASSGFAEPAPNAPQQQLTSAPPAAVNWNFAALPLGGGAGMLQPKLKIGAVDDPLEREADSLADHVMRMPDKLVQRKCANCKEEDDDKKRGA